MSYESTIRNAPCTPINSVPLSEALARLGICPWGVTIYTLRACTVRCVHELTHDCIGLLS